MYLIRNPPTTWTKMSWLISRTILSQNKYFIVHIMVAEPSIVTFDIITLKRETIQRSEISQFNSQSLKSFVEKYKRSVWAFKEDYTKRLSSKTRDIQDAFQNAYGKTGHDLGRYRHCQPHSHLLRPKQVPWEHREAAFLCRGHREAEEPPGSDLHSWIASVHQGKMQNIKRTTVLPFEL